MRTPWPHVALAFILAFALLGVSTSPARAQTPPAPELRLELHVDPCVDVAGGEVRRIVAIELRAAVWDTVEHDPKTTRVDVRCDGGKVKLDVLDPLTGKSLARLIALDDVATNARARLLALAIAELVATSWSELESNPQPAVPPVAPTPRDEDKSAARAVVATRLHLPPPSEPREPRTTWRATATLDTRWMTVGSDPLLGVGVRVGADPFRRVGFVLDFALEHGSVASSLGTVGVDSYSLGAAALVRSAIAPFVFRGGAGIRAGVARMVGIPDSSDRAEGHTVSGLWGAPIATGSVGLRIVGRLLLELSTEVGYVVVPVRGTVQGGTDARIDGFFLAGAVGFGLEL